ncbi:DUF3465 domain-containing protein [Sulfurimonas sp.]|uniref:DUF3465 domain-containing protein n=1 Tax=Sulfurimonas sp. TaxID=2022749 RepID=UPI003562BA02
MIYINKILIFTFLLYAISINVLANDAKLHQAYQNKYSDLQIQGSGTVIRILPDDNKGSRHQKFIVKLKSNQTLLISHNIDLSNRISNLKIGDTVEFYGEYEWNHKGGVIHWTHKDPKNRHVHGWLKHRGKTYD